VSRGVDDLLADLAEAADAAAELVGLGKERWDTERPRRLAVEAVVGRPGDIATKLPDEVIKATPEIPWREVKGMRIITAHAYHRIDYEEVWVTLRDDVICRTPRAERDVAVRARLTAQLKELVDGTDGPRQGQAGRTARRHLDEAGPEPLPAGHSCTSKANSSRSSL
jgi:uncharacterized protein with HEPN domain